MQLNPVHTDLSIEIRKATQSSEQSVKFRLYKKSTHVFSKMILYTLYELRLGATFASLATVTVIEDRRRYSQAVTGELLHAIMLRFHTVKPDI